MRLIILRCLLACLGLSLLSCNSGPAWQEKTINAKTYEYRELVKQVKDLHMDVIGTKWIETEHCLIQYSTRYAPFIDSIISVPENAYAKVSHDLRCTTLKSKVPVFYLDPQEYRRLPSSLTGGFTLGCFTDTQTVVINVQQFPFANDSATLVTNHEMAHIMAGALYGPWKPPQRRDDGKVRFSSHNAYEEALCQHEEPRAWLAENLLLMTPATGYLTLADMDTLSYDGPYNFTYVEFRALIRLITERWGWEAVLEVPLERDTHTFRECLEKATGAPYAQLEPQWFAYMDSLRNSCGTTIHGGAQ